MCGPAGGGLPEVLADAVSHTRMLAVVGAFEQSRMQLLPERGLQAAPGELAVNHRVYLPAPLPGKPLRHECRGPHAAVVRTLQDFRIPPRVPASEDCLCQNADKVAVGINFMNHRQLLGFALFVCFC